MKNSGFIALFSVIIISTVLLLAAVSASFTGFFGRLNVFNGELKAESDHAALACIERARLVLAEDNTFTGTDTETVGTETCTYDVSGGGEIIAHAEVNDAFTYYYAEVDLDEVNVPVTLFKECADLSPCP